MDLVELNDLMIRSNRAALRARHRTAERADLRANQNILRRLRPSH